MKWVGHIQRLHGDLPSLLSQSGGQLLQRRLVPAHHRLDRGVDVGDFTQPAFLLNGIHNALERRQGTEEHGTHASINSLTTPNNTLRPLLLHITPPFSFLPIEQHNHGRTPRLTRTAQQTHQRNDHNTPQGFSTEPLQYCFYSVVLPEA